MRFHLMTADSAQRAGEHWVLSPTVRLRDLIERGPLLLMPLAGEALELHVPDGRVIPAIIAMFGLSAWKRGDGSFYTTEDPADLRLTLTITCSADLAEIPPGTEVWLSDARSSEP